MVFLIDRLDYRTLSGHACRLRELRDLLLKY